MNKSKFSLELEDNINIHETDKVALKKFAAGAITHNTDLDTSIEEDWRNEDKNGLPTYNFRLRLNKYEVGLLKYVASLEKRSMSNLIKVIINDELSKRI